MLDTNTMKKTKERPATEKRKHLPLFVLLAASVFFFTFLSLSVPPVEFKSRCSFSKADTGLFVNVFHFYNPSFVLLKSP